MAPLVRIASLALSFSHGLHALKLSSSDSEDADDCNKVVFDRIDKDLHVRTMVVEDSNRQRMLVLTADNDTSMPCKPRWWLDHNPQGVVQCLGAPANASVSQANQATSCDVAQCKADAADVQLGYVRTMLASAVFFPQPHTLSAICIELGCRSRITKSRVETLLETGGPEKVQWAPRSQLKRVLVIGLGSSTMANWLRQQLPDTELHVAELVPGVAAAAPCFGLDSASGRDSRLHLHVGDGRSVLQRSEDGQFDAILVDAFDHDASLPPCFRTSEFFSIARKKLVPGGSLSFNLYSDGHSKVRIVKALTQTFDSSHIWVGDAPGAEGIQEVLTAFAPGRPAARVGKEARVSASGRVRDWWGAAHYRSLHIQALSAVKPFEDASECPNQNAPHHG